MAKNTKFVVFKTRIQQQSLINAANFQNAAPAHAPRITRCLSSPRLWSQSISKRSMFCLGVLQFLPHSTLWLQIVSAFFFPFNVNYRAVRWSKNSGTRTRMILREMEVSVGTQTNSRELPVVASLYLFVVFRFRAIRVTTRYFFLTFYLALFYPGKSNLRFSPWNPGISLHQTFFFLRSVKSHCGSWFRAYTFVSIRFVGSVPDLKFLSRRKTKHRNN